MSITGEHSFKMRGSKCKDVRGKCLLLVCTWNMLLGVVVLEEADDGGVLGGI